jgi:hypothetical protein
VIVSLFIHYSYIIIHYHFRFFFYRFYHLRQYVQPFQTQGTPLSYYGWEWELWKFHHFQWRRMTEGKNEYVQCTRGNIIGWNYWMTYRYNSSRAEISFLRIYETDFTVDFETYRSFLLFKQKILRISWLWFAIPLPYMYLWFAIVWNKYFCIFAHFALHLHIRLFNFLLLWRSQILRLRWETGGTSTSEQNLEFESNLAELVLGAGWSRRLSL